MKKRTIESLNIFIRIFKSLAAEKCLGRAPYLTRGFLLKPRPQTGLLQFADTFAEHPSVNERGSSGLQETLKDKTNPF